MAKTIKQIADELGVSKTAVRKKIENLGLQSSLRKNGNQFAIEKDQESLIKAAFLKKETETKPETKTETVSGLVSGKVSENRELVSVLQNEIKAKNEQLKEKDRQLAAKDEQISALNQMLADSQKLLDQQQQLTAIAEQRLCLLEQHTGTGEETDDPDQECMSKHWWQFWK